MTGKSHLIFGLGTGAIAALASKSPFFSFLCVPIVGMSALLPDIDSNSSIIGRRVKIIGKIFKHRGIVHTPCFMLLFLLIPQGVVRQAAFVGFASHLFLDLFNKGGIPLLWPISKAKFRIANLKSGTRGEGIIVALLLIVELLVFVGVRFF